jgi:hypothetical protein
VSVRLAAILDMSSVICAEVLGDIKSRKRKSNESRILQFIPY